MSTRKIPEIVYDAGYAAYVHGGTPTAIIEAAMPLAFAAELRVLLAEMEDYEKLGEVFRLIESRIAELDPEGLTP